MAAAGNLIVDYSYDTSGFFPMGGEARATLEKAAADLSAVLADGQLGGLVDNKITGDSNGTTVTVTWSLHLTDPADGDNILLETPHLAPGFAADEIRIFVGWRNLGGATLGQGGPARNANLSFQGSGDPAEFENAVAAMDAASDVVMGRGGGPVISQFSGAVGGHPWNLNYGSFMGSLWFDSDTDNDGSADVPSLLESSWNLGLGMPAAGQNDFYSVALHEMMHAIGFGNSVSWNALAGDPNISGGHLISGLTGTRLSDGTLQEALMDPTLTQGNRKELTTTDLQYLSHIGFAVVPEPGTGLLALGAGAALLHRRRKSDGI